MSARRIAPAPTALEVALTPLAKLLATALAPMVSAELARIAEPDPWLPHPRWPFSRRKSLQLARTGKIEHVRRDGRTYFARLSAIDHYLDARPVVALEVSDATNDTDGVSQEDLLATWGQELAPRASRRGHR